MTKLSEMEQSRLGKPGKRFMNSVVFKKLGARSPDVVVGPSFGVDNSVIRIGKSTVMVATVDPLSFIPEISARDSAWLSIHLIASDLATSGFAPQYGIFDFNLPPSMKERQFRSYWQAFHDECTRLGLSVVGGHTGWYQGCDYTIIGGGMLWAIGHEDEFITSNMAGSGDDIVLTKGAAIEATAMLTRVFSRKVRNALGTELFEKAWSYLTKVSTVNDSLVAASVGIHRDGVTAMHDATEGGVVAAILELAEASGLRAAVDLDAITISPETSAVCKLFGIDPMVSLSEGSLVIAVRPNKTGKLVSKLKSRGVPADVIGRLTSGTKSVCSTGNRRNVPLRYPPTDPYWRAYWRAVARHWR